MKLVSGLYALKPHFLSNYGIEYVLIDVDKDCNWFLYKGGRKESANPTSTWQCHLDWGNIYPALPDYMQVAEGL